MFIPLCLVIMLILDYSNFLFAAILGTFWGILYQYMRFGYSVGILVYVAFFYMLVFQFFRFFFQFFLLQSLLSFGYSIVYKN